MKIWRLNLKPAPDNGLSFKDVFEFCQKNKIVGVGWRDINIRTDDYRELKSYVETIYTNGSTRALKALNAMREMEINDLIYTRFDGTYFICRVTSKWTESNPTNEHYCYDIYNYVEVEWINIGTEDNVPGKVINSFGPSATVQQVYDVEKISKLLYNNFTKNDFKYPVDSIGLKDFWQLISSEDLECLIMLYLQSKGYYIYSSTLKLSTAKIECVMIKNDGSHKCFPQVKRQTTLYGQEYENILNNHYDKVFLFTTSQNYIKSDIPQIEYISLNEIEDFVKANKNLLPTPILNWVKIWEEF